MEHFPVAFVIDDNCAMQTAVTITSLLVNKNVDVNYKFYVCCNGISQQNKNLLYSLGGVCPGTLMEFVDIDYEGFDHIYIQPNSKEGAGSKTALGKFLLPEVIPEDRVLYLDADIIVRKDISELFSLSLDDYVAAVVKDVGSLFYRTHVLASMPDYFNSGVMLLNLKRCRELDMTSRLIEAKEGAKDLRLVDQDAFNEVFDGMTLQLPIKYNALLVNLNHEARLFSMAQLNELAGTCYSCLYDLDDEAKIVHFASYRKPWLYEDLQYESMRLSDEWLAYYRTSPYGGSKLQLEKLYSNSMHNMVGYGEVPVVIDANKGSLFGACVTAISMLENADSDRTYLIYILISRVADKETAARIEDLLSAYGNCRVEVCWPDEALVDLVTVASCNPDSSNYMLILANLFPQYDKVIYLGSNVVVTGDIAGLFDIDLIDKYLGGVRVSSIRYLEDCHGLYGKLADLSESDWPVDTTVLLLNLKRLREDGVAQEIMDGIVRSKSSPEESNDAWQGRIKYLDLKYNYSPAVHEPDSKAALSTGELNEASNRPIIIRFEDKEQPWKNLCSPLADRWWKYARMVPDWESFLQVDAAEVDSLVEKGKSANFSASGMIDGIFGGVCVANYITAVLYLKNSGASFNNLVMLGSSDPDVQISKPAWSNRDGLGSSYEILSRRGRLNIRFRCIGDGDLNVSLRSEIMSDEHRNRIPIWIEYTSLLIDGEAQLAGSVAASESRPYRYTKPVRDGEVVDLCVSWVIANNDDRQEAENRNLRFQIKEIGELNKRLSNRFTARLDVKDAGAPENDVEVLELSDPSARVEAPAWFGGEDGTGRVVRSDAGSLGFRVRCSGAGELELALRGQYVRAADGERVPVWIDYTSFTVDERELLGGTCAVWHDRPFKHRMPVTDGQVVAVSLTWHSHDEAGLAAERGRLDAAHDEAEALRAENERLQGRVAERDADLKALRAAEKREAAARAAAEADALALRSSNSWKVGRFITWLPRKIKGWIHGLER